MGDFQDNITYRTEWWRANERRHAFMRKELNNIGLQLSGTERNARINPAWQHHTSDEADLIPLWGHMCVKCRQAFAPGEVTKRITQTESLFHFGCAFLVTQTADLYSKRMNVRDMTLLATHPHWCGTYFYKDGVIMDHSPYA